MILFNFAPVCFLSFLSTKCHLSFWISWILWILGDSLWSYSKQRSQQNKISNNKKVVAESLHIRVHLFKTPACMKSVNLQTTNDTSRKILTVSYWDWGFIIYCFFDSNVTINESFWGNLYKKSFLTIISKTVTIKYKIVPAPRYLFKILKWVKFLN